jgi:hypothetical protein
MAPDRIKPVLDAIRTDDPAKVRAAAQKQLKKIQAAQAKLNQDAKLVRDLASRYGPAQDSLTPKKRSEKVRGAALALVDAGQSIVTSQEILSYLEQNDGIRFDVRKPASLVGTVMNGMKGEFKAIERNRYAYIGNRGQSTNGVVDLDADNDDLEGDDNESQDLTT